MKTGANDPMKIKLLLNKKMPLWVIGIILLVVTFLAIVGFRITYAPELENSWSAISAVASWAGVVATVIAIIVAIQIPQKIADNQNKIALFDKRYEVYDTIMRLVSFSKFIETMGRDKLSTEDVQVLFVALFSSSPIKNSLKETLNYERSSFFMNAVMAIQKGAPLFDMDIESDLSALVMSLMRIIYDMNNQTEIDEISKYIEAANKVESCILPKIKKTLQVTK